MQITPPVHLGRHHHCTAWPDMYDKVCRLTAAKYEHETVYDRTDLFQVAAEKLWRERPDPHEGGLCYRIADRAIIDWLRVHGPAKRSGQPRGESHVYDPDRVVAWEGEWDDRTPTPAVPDIADQVVDDIVHRSRIAWLRDKVKHMGGKRGQVTRLRLQGATRHEISHIMNMTIGTVDAHLFLARRELRRQAHEV